MSKIAIIGSGDWATALVHNLSHNNDIIWCVRDHNDATRINMKGYHSHFACYGINTHKVTATSNINDAISDANYIIIATPTTYIQCTLMSMNAKSLKDIVENKIWIVASKGLIRTNDSNICIISEWLSDEYDIPEDNIAILTGPCHAEEMIRDKRNFLTIATSNNFKNSEAIKSLFSSKYNTITVINDSIFCKSVQLITTLKNTIAIAAGIFDGLNYGHNMKSVLVTNAIKYVSSMFTNPIDMNTSACIGDILVTAYSTYSRNYNYGLYLAEHGSKDDNLPEGHYGTKNIMTYCNIDDDYNIVEFVSACIDNPESCREYTEKLILTLS